MRGKGITLAAVTGMAGVLQAPASLGYEAGDWLIRGRMVIVEPDENSSTVKAGGVPLAGGKVGLENDAVPEIDFTYMLSRNWGLELILASSEHDIEGAGTLGALGGIADARTLPPTLTLQYHFRPHGAFRPYAGVGVNYTHFFDEDAVSSFQNGIAGGRADVDLDDSFGLAAQVGADFAVNADWFVNVDLKYVQMDTEATIKTAAPPAGLGKVKVDVEIDPWIFGIGIGRRF